MKKFITVFLALAMLLSLAACDDKNPQDTSDSTTEPTTTTTTESALSGSLEEIIDKIYKNAAENNSSKAYAAGDSMYFINVTPDRQEYFYGCTFDYEEAAASEYQISSAYSLSLIRLPDGADVEATMTMLRDNINPMRWICMGVEKVLVVNVGNIIGVFMMTEADATILSNSFLDLAGK